METTIPLLFAAVVGFTHAFEADHLVAVSNIVTRRERSTFAMKDGMFWGLGHASTILIIGIIILVGKAAFQERIFTTFEGVVGLMLVWLGVYRLYQYFNNRTSQVIVHDDHTHHKLAYGVGLIHGLAGSGAMILLVMSNFDSTLSALIYLVIFGLGSAVGMLVAAGLFSLPFTQKMISGPKIQLILIVVSSALCIGYGGYVMIENWA